MKRRSLTIGIVLIILILSGSATALVIHANKSKSLNSTAAVAANSSDTVKPPSQMSSDTNKVCSSTSDTVSGPANVTLTITVTTCKLNGIFSSSTATSSYTNKNDVSIGYVAPIQKAYDSTNGTTPYNASVSYSYQSSDGATQSGSYLLILHADVTNSGLVSFNQSNGG
jgi:hypothetical protein